MQFELSNQDMFQLLIKITKNYYYLKQQLYQKAKVVSLCRTFRSWST